MTQYKFKIDSDQLFSLLVMRIPKLEKVKEDARMLAVVELFADCVECCVVLEEDTTK